MFINKNTTTAMRNCIIILAILFSKTLFGQPLNNEWIDYSKTYYKFSVGSSGMYRITPNQLATVGLQSTPSEQFQLWRNGKQVPLYVTIPSGPLSPTDYIQFYGLINDGKPDKYLYRDTTYQLNDQISLQTDTAAYFLTVNPITTQNLRFLNAPNNANGGTAATLDHFDYTQRFSLRDQINPGYAYNVGENIYSSSYDIGELFSSNDITNTSPYSIQVGNLYPYAGYPATVAACLVGGSYKTRPIRVDFNSTNLINDTFNGFDARVDYNNNVNMASANGPNNNFNVYIVTSDSFDRAVCGYVEISYKRAFNFGGANVFTFKLPPSANQQNISITNFSSSSLPFLYDLVHYNRYQAFKGGQDTLKFSFPPTSDTTRFCLVSEDPQYISFAQGMQQRNFINFSNPAYQGNYLIISNKLLMTGSNPVEQYRSYRSSATGGGYNAKIYDIDELVDQFAYGIKKHPLSVRNFIRFATANFAQTPSLVFIIGKGTTYVDFRNNESSPNISKLDLVPTFGWPPSDALLASPGPNPGPTVPIGRLSAIFTNEVSNYLDKVKQYEQPSTTPTLAATGWRKQFVHVAGTNDPVNTPVFIGYLANYENIAKRPPVGANVANFNDRSTGAGSTATNDRMSAIWASGINMLTYFGHSASTVLDYNLSDPTIYNNSGKYPVMLINGCSAGNFYDFDTSRYTTLTSLAEKFIFTPQKGAIGFIATTHFGLTTYLDTYTTGYYQSYDGPKYGKPMGNYMVDAIKALQSSSSNFQDYFARTHSEQMVLEGDPGIVQYSFAKPDFDVEDPQVAISPSIISVADSAFTIKAYIYNIGKAVVTNGDTATLSVKIVRQYPNGNTSVIYYNRIPAVRYQDSVVLNVPIVASRDKGTNKITVTVDSDNQYDELSKTNNSITKTFVVLDNGLTPVYPYNFAIVHQQNITLQASTANPISPVRNYIMQLDTTELFNSPLLVTKTISSSGGIVGFNPGITFTDSTVYYWRVAQMASNGANSYSGASFIYLANGSDGFSQAHFYQHLKSTGTQIYMDSLSRSWKYTYHSNLLTLNNAIFNSAHGQPSDFEITLNGNIVTQSACVGHSIIFNIFDPVTLKPYYNQQVPSTVQNGPSGGFLGIPVPPSCIYDGKEFNFEQEIDDTTGRRQLRDLLNWAPDKAVITARVIYNDGIAYAADWKSDRQYYGNNTLYDVLLNAGFTNIDSFNKPVPWVFVYKKNDPTFTPASLFGATQFDGITLNKTVPSLDSVGYLTSPTFGPALAWKQFVWKSVPSETTPGDRISIDVVGIDTLGNETNLMTTNNVQGTMDISTINASLYPNIKLAMFNQDSVNLTPSQLQYWRLLYSPVPEGAIAPNLFYQFTDSLQQGQTLPVAFAFKNISNTAFTDSIPVNLTITDQNNVTTTLPTRKFKKLVAGDTAIFSTTINTASFNGNNTIYLDINPASKLPEQYHFNNFVYENFYVATQNKKPILDVTFDGVHILNNDIVSSKPNIRMLLKSESMFLPLDDTSLFTIQLRYPDGSIRQYPFTQDTLKFLPANLGTGHNVATALFSPYLPVDGTYELIVQGKDKQGNTTGVQPFRVSFVVYNVAGVGNLFNYPNPFTTSTAFVFTLTGSKVPQQFKIQIFTVTGKLVKEITQSELGPIHIGNNITQYKWDATDNYGSRLANGVYLYRLVTSLDGSSMNKLGNVISNSPDAGTDQFFNGGYGKMYLMR